MLKYLLIITALVITSTQLFSKEEDTPQEKLKVTLVDTLNFKDYNFYKISLTEAKFTRYLVSKKENFLRVDKTRYSKIKKEDFLDINTLRCQFPSELQS